MNQFVQRVANYVANEVIIKGLAHNKTFQRFALRTDQQLKEVNKMTTDKITQTVEELSKTTTAGAAAAAAGPPKPVLPAQSAPRSR